MAQGSSRGPLAFHIGLAETGGDWLAGLFEANRLIARRDVKGALSRDIARAQRRGQEPLTRWPNAALFAALHPDDGSEAQGAAAFAFLDRWFPKAVFLLTERRPEDWIAAMFTRDGGAFRAREARRRGVDEADLPALWDQDWNAHIDAVATHFAGSDRLIRFDIDRDDPAGLVTALSPWFSLPRLPGKGPRPSDLARQARIEATLRHLAPRPKRAAPPPGKADPDFVSAVSKHCLGRTEDRGGALPLDFRSDVYAEWDGGARVTGRTGAPLPLLRSATGDDGRFFRTGESQKLARIQGVLNELLDLGMAMPLTVDMQDARFFGRWDRPVPPRPMLAYNRLAGVENLVLWPLPGYHTPGSPQFPGRATRDEIAFEDKRDQVVWRGNLTGRPRLGLDPETGRVRRTRRIYADLARLAPDSPAAQARIAQLCSIPRAEFVRRFGAHPDFDVALTPARKHAALREIAPLAAHVGAVQPPDWFHRFRYVVSLAGNDTGSNFLVAAASRSVVMKEEDPWELFYTRLFRPWEHYIPLAEAGADAEDKLAWARANPDACKAMSAAARAVCAQIADPANRKAVLTEVARGYAAARTA